MNAGLSTISAKPLERNQSVRSVQELWARLRLMCPLEIIASGLQQKRSYLDWNYGFFLGFEKIWDNVGTQLNMIYNKGQLIFRKFNAKLLHIYQLRQHGWWKPTVAGNAIKQFSILCRVFAWGLIVLKKSAITPTNNSCTYNTYYICLWQGIFSYCHIPMSVGFIWLIW